ncbi:MAG TPA: hypothetical protein VJ782_02265 [Aeromicrobium sp.]|nr:hypothetical protein [Aeromicrobium sp.]
MSRLTEPQVTCLWGLWLGSKGRGSNARTLESLRHRGLAFSMKHQGEEVWEPTSAGSALVAALSESEES